jgi:aryl-alcohol dehydrogenase-like predicted oxidoreductase
VQLATKVGIDRSNGDHAWVLRGEPAYIKRGLVAYSPLGRGFLTGT